MIFLPSLFYAFLLATLLKLTSQQTTVCNPLNRPTSCGYDYTPVCSFPTGCNDYTCTYTSRNACNACQSTAVAYYINGACPQDSIGGDTDSGDSDTGDTGETETETETGTGGIEPGDNGNETNSTNSTIPDGNSTPNNTDIDTNSTTNSTDGSGNVNNTDSSNGSTPSTPGNGTDTSNSTNSTNSTTNNTNTDTDTNTNTAIPCADYGAMIRSSGKIVLGALCCGSEPTKCPKTSTQVCGVLTNCIGDVCRKTYKNYCKACHDNTTSVQLYLNAPCETLFGS